MRVNEVINSRSVAISAENEVKTDYLGRAFFPEKKKAGLDLKWIVRNGGLPVSLAPSNFDTLPVIRTRGNVDVMKTEMPFFRETSIVTETDANEIDRAVDAGDPFLASALASIYNDTNNLVASANVVAERMRMQLLATTNGHPTIGISADGVTYAYDYDPNGTYASSHYVKLTGQSAWSDTTNSTPITDLNTAKRNLRTAGRVAKYALMNSNTFAYLLNNTQVKNSIISATGVNITDVDDATAINVIKARTGLQILLYDEQYLDASGTAQYFYPNNKVTLIAEGGLGSTWYGTTPEERTARNNANVDVSIYGTGVAIAVKTDYGPPEIDTITASEIVLPSYENMNGTYVLEVA